MSNKDKKYIEDAYRIIVYLALLMHAFFAVVFFSFGAFSMGVYNVCIVAAYISFAVLVYKKYYRMATALVHLEICCFVAVSTILLGWGYNFAVYLFAMESLVYFNPFKKSWKIYLFSGLEIAEFFVLKVLTTGQAPVIATEHNLSYVFSFVNYLGCFGTIIIGALVSRVATDSMARKSDRIMRDALTGVYQREYFFHRVEEIFQETLQKKYVLVCTNISGFKFFNELFGEKKGDEVLVAQAEMLREIAGDLEVYGRLSGDEFGLLVEKEKFREETLVDHAKKMQKQFGSDFYRMHVYAGVYEIEDMHEPVAVMCDKARIAQESIRGELNANIAYYNNQMMERSLINRRIMGEFEQALVGEQFCIYLQPQMSEKGEVLGAEALVRWNHPERGLIPPGEFIPVFESSGLICQLDLFVWEEAAKRLREWKDAGQENLSISVNISAKDFYHMDIYQTFVDLVERYDIAPANLKLEITETVLMQDVQSLLLLIKRLREYGFEIEIDDFGSGYSSLNMLKDITVDVLKIDMGFLRESEQNQRCWAILNTIMELARSLEMRVITEGVETEEQLKNLTDIGCVMFQGYYFSRPVPLEVFEREYM